MPVTRSELAFFTAGMVVGAVGHAAYPKLKEKLGALVEAALAGAGDGIGDGYAAMAQAVAERFGANKETMASAAYTNGTQPSGAGVT